jgi:hypothetical protein
MDNVFAFEAKDLSSSLSRGTMKSQKSKTCLAGRRIKSQKLFIISCLGFLFFPIIATAAYEYNVDFFDDVDSDGYRDPGENIVDTRTATYEGLVPCGTCVKFDPAMTPNSFDEERCGPGAVYNKYMSCQLCHAFIMARGILDFLLLPPRGIVFILGVLMIVIAGAMFIYGNLMAPGNPQVLANTQKAMTAAVVGLVIIFGAWVFINVLFALIGVANWTSLREGWFTIDCPVLLPHP